MAQAAGRTYTLDADPETGQIQIKDGRDPITQELSTLLSINASFQNRNALIKEQQAWNYLDAIKDGTNVFQLNALNIYFTSNDISKGKEPKFSQLHVYEDSLLNQKKDNLLRTTWLKTKKESKLNLIQAHYVFWEAGLGFESFIELLTPDLKEALVVTFGSYIDPLSKPGRAWPPVNDTVEITPTFMEQFGFGKSSIRATTKNPNIIVGDGRTFDYSMNIACGEGCNPRVCEFNHSATPKDENSSYFNGNKAKNELVKSQKGGDGLKTKLIVAKGWGDKVQVMLYYMFYHLKKSANKLAIMTTCDFVVFCFCITLGIPCVYTGAYDRGVVVPTREIKTDAKAQREKISYFSILQFNPGNEIDNARQSYKNTVTRLLNENTEFIENVLDLIENYNTPVEVRGMAMFTFLPAFYQILYDDMMEINKMLEQQLNRMNEEDTIERIIDETNLLKKTYLIVPMFKFVSKGNKIIMLQTKLYTADNNIMPRMKIVTEHGKKNSMTFCNFAMDRFTPQRGGVVEKKSARQQAIKMNSKQLGDPEKEQFPTRDTTPKLFHSMGEHMDIKENTSPVKDAPLFTEELDTPIVNNIQPIFDINLYKAIELLTSEVVQSNNNVSYEGGGKRSRTRRRQRGGMVDEILFETLYTLYVYRAQYDMELDTPDLSIDMDVLEELYNEYPTDVQSNRSSIKSNTRKNVRRLVPTPNHMPYAIAAYGGKRKKRITKRKKRYNRRTRK